MKLRPPEKRRIAILSLENQPINRPAGPQGDELDNDEDDSSSVDTWDMEDDELLSTFNYALDSLNLESEQAILLQRLLADIDTSAGTSAEAPGPVSAYIEELPTTSQSTRPPQAFWLSGLLGKLRPKRSKSRQSARRKGSEGHKSRTRSFTWTRVLSLLRISKRGIRTPMSTKRIANNC